MVKIAINGFGRIGRNVTRALFTGPHRDNIQLVAINDLGDAKINAHLLQYDTAHGFFDKTVEVDNDSLVIDGQIVKVFAERDPSKLKWNELDVDIVLECTGLFTTKETAGAHLAAGAKRVLISAPAQADATIVYGVNHNTLKPEDTIISNASCTTNCLAPIVKVLNDGVGIERGLANTVHAYTNDQKLSDVYHSDLRRARAAGHNMIPSKTGAAAAIGLVIPELAGKLDGLAIRVPTLNVSLLDFTFTASGETSAEEINSMIRSASLEMSDVLAVNELPLVSSDFNHNSASSIVDLTQTKVEKNLVKILAWYDNEWGFSNRMLDNAFLISQYMQNNVVEYQTA